MLESLRLQNFRCFDQLGLKFQEKGAVFIGDNAQGKTSLLEAICVLLRLQSPRTHRLKQLVKFETPAFGIAGGAFGAERRVDYGLTNQSGLTLRRDGEEVASTADYLSGGGLVVWMGNEDLKLVRGPGEDRRHFLDFIGMQVEPGYRRAATRYRKALKARNALLKDRRATRKSIDAYTAILVEEGAVIQQGRTRIVADLAEHAAAAQKAVSAKDESLVLDYKWSGGENLAETLDMAFQKDLDLRQTTIGPHRDDLSLKLNGLPARDYASEGQQRTLVLALKLAQGRLLQQRSESLPLFLIDDVFGELDGTRRNALLEWIPDEAQCFITTTTLDWMTQSSREWPVFRVTEGSVEG